MTVMVLSTAFGNFSHLCRTIEAAGRWFRIVSVARWGNDRRDAELVLTATMTERLLTATVSTDGHQWFNRSLAWAGKQTTAA